jgi:hypothetical protein
MKVSKVVILEISDLNTISIECASCGARVILRLKDAAQLGKRGEIPGGCPSCDDDWKEIRLEVQRFRESLASLERHNVTFHVPKPAAKA